MSKRLNYFGLWERISQHLQHSVADYALDHRDMRYFENAMSDFCALENDLAEARAEIERLLKQRDALLNATVIDVNRWHEAEAELAALKAQVSTLFDAIKHGDQEHQDWLADKITAHFAESPK